MYLTEPSIFVALSTNKLVVSSNNLLAEQFDSFITVMRGLAAKYNMSRKLHYLPKYKLPHLLLWSEKKQLPLVLSEEVVGLIKYYKEKADQLALLIDERQAFVSGKRLFPFQEQGALWLSFYGSGLLADDMGTGKTIQSLMAIPENSRVMVICPAIAKAVWKKAAADWRSDYTVEVLSGMQKSLPKLEPNNIIIANYDILRTVKLPTIKSLFDVLIVDEAHYCKSYSAGRTKAVRSIARKSKAVWTLTGTPMFTDYKDLYKILLLSGWHKRSFKSWDDYEKKLGVQQVGWTKYQTTTTEEGGIAISLGMLRRTKDDVLPELPEKMIQEIEVKIDKKLLLQCDEVVKALTNKYGSNIDDWLTDADHISEIARLRSDLATAKIEAMLEIVEDFESNDTPLVVFSYHRAPIETLAKRDGWRGILSGVSRTNVDKYQEEFQSGKLKGIALTIGAGSTAITLTHASHMLFVDLDWTPASNSQAADRLHRIGQKNAVNIYLLVANHDMDAQVMSVLATKMRNIDHTVNLPASSTSTFNIRNTLSYGLSLPVHGRFQNEISSEAPVDYFKVENTKIFVKDDTVESVDDFIRKWSYCTRCPISAKSTNTQFAFYKFYIPCDILFIGEGPGQVESSSGIPFSGPAGQLFSSAIKDAGFSSKTPPLLGFTNVICCRPTKHSESGFITNRQPSDEEKSLCKERLIEIVRLANPKRIIAVGRVAEEWLTSHTKEICKNIPFQYLVHPSYVLRRGGIGTPEYTAMVDVLTKIREEPLPPSPNDEPFLFD